MITDEQAQIVDESPSKEEADNDDESYDMRRHHDEFFKISMKDLRIARTFLTHHLPKHILQQTNLQELHIESTNFIKTTLDQCNADMLYRSEIDGRTGYFYLLIEHQSSGDQLMALRIYEYMLAIMYQHARTHRTNVLPVVYPVVFYTGKWRYTACSRFFDLFDPQDQQLAQEVFNGMIQLVDVNQFSEETVNNHEHAGVMEWVMRQIHRAEFREICLEVGQLFQKFFDMDDIYWRDIINYVLGGKTNVNSEVIAMTAQELPKPLNLAAMTAAQRLHYEGHKEGRQEGRQEERIILAKNLLVEGMSAENIARLTGLTIEEISNI